MRYALNTLRRLTHPPKSPLPLKAAETLYNSLNKHYLKQQHAHLLFDRYRQSVQRRERLHRACKIIDEVYGRSVRGSF